jgi:uncharacterized protein (DUF58 family)
MTEVRYEDILDSEFMSKIERLQLVSRKVIVGKIRGERLTRKRGQSVEFADYRQYVSGDDLRFLDWNLYARLDRLFLKLFLEEEDLHVYLLLDASESMGYGTPTKFHYARKVVAALAYIALSNYDRVVLGAFGGEPVSRGAGEQGGSASVGLPAPRSGALPRAPGQERLSLLPAGRGKGYILRVLDFLLGLRAEGPTSLAPVFRQFALSHRRPGVVVLVSDFLDKGGYEEALRYFLATNQDVFVLHLLAREELDPALVGDLKLVDMEDAETTEVTVSWPVLRAYRRTVESFCAGLKRYVGSRGMNYLLASTAVDFDVLVLDYLRRRGLVA